MSQWTSFYWNVLYRNDQSMSLRWIAPLCAGLALMPTFGSSVSAGVIVAAVISWMILVAHLARFLPLTPAEKLYGTIAGAYAFIALIAAFSNENASQAPAATASYLGFLLVLPILPMLRYYQDGNWRRWIRYSIAAGSILAGLWSLGEVVWFRHIRAEALTGNPLIFAYLAGVWGVMNCWIGLHARGQERIVHLVGTLLSLIAIFLSASRAPLAFFGLAVGSAFLAWLISGRSERLRNGVLVSIVLAGAAMFAYLAMAQTLAFQRVILRLQTRFESIFDALPGAGSSLGLGDANLEVRLAMLKAGFEAVLNRPLLGYGRQNVMDAAGRLAGGEAFPFTHLHNAYLTEAVASGVPGLMTFAAVLCLPLIVARKGASPTFGMAVLIVAFTALYSLTNIGFSHDIKVFSYCVVVFALALLAGEGSMISPSQAANYAGFLSPSVRANAARSADEG